MEERFKESESAVRERGKGGREGGKEGGVALRQLWLTQRGGMVQTLSLQREEERERRREGRRDGSQTTGRQSGGEVQGLLSCV